MQLFGGFEPSTVAARQQWSFDVDGRTRMVRPPVRMSATPSRRRWPACAPAVGVARLLSHQVGTRPGAHVRALIDFAGLRLRALAVPRGG